MNQVLINHYFADVFEEIAKKDDQILEMTKLNKDLSGKLDLQKQIESMQE